MSRLRAELLLPLTIVSAAVMVAVSEFMTTFEFTSGGEPQALSLASERHSYALLILAVLTVAGMTYAIVTGLRAAAVGTAVLGLTALFLFLVLDLPDAGKAGPLGEDPTIYFADARADPDTGFWLAAVGTVVLGLATVAFATLSSAQLRAPAELIRARWGKKEQQEEEMGEPLDAEAEKPSKERTAAREHLARTSAKPSAEAREESTKPAEEKEPSRPGLLRRLRNNGG